MKNSRYTGFFILYYTSSKILNIIFWINIVYGWNKKYAILKVFWISISLKLMKGTNT